MTSTTTNEIEASRFVTALTASDLATGPPEDIVPERGAASANDLRPSFGRAVGNALARGERAVSGVMRRLGDVRARRRTVRELRLLGRSRLADLGIEPDRTEDVADAMVAARRRRQTTRPGR